MKVAPSRVVEVYKILNKAGKLTVPQIAEQMPKSLNSAAMNAYRVYKEQVDPTWLEGKPPSGWSKTAQHEAMVWWVGEIVKEGIIAKNFTATKTAGNQRINQRIISCDQPPTVERRFWIEKTTHVPWTLNDTQALNAGASAGMEFIRKYDKYLEQPKVTQATLKELLSLADRAIRAKYQNIEGSD